MAISGSYDNGGVEIHPLDDLSANDYSQDPGYQVMIEYGLSELVTAEFCELMRTGIFTFNDLDERTMEFAKNQSPEHARFVLNQFRKSNLIGVQTPVQYLGSLLKNFKERVKILGADVALATPVFYAPKLENLQDLLNRTGYSMEVTVGQRKYGGPPPGYDGPAPSGGCEVYIGRVPKNVYEDELVPVLEKFGTLFDFRLMMDPVSGTNKGYAFATFMKKSEAAEAAKNLEDYEVKPGKKLRCNVSIANTRLFIGNIPKSKSKDDILKEFSQTAEIEGIKEVIIYPDADDPVNKPNCGYCFIEFLDHKAASTAKRRLVDGHVRPWNSTSAVMVNWAEPQEEPDDESMSQVRTVFVKNLRAAADEEIVKNAFAVFGEVNKVRRIKDYAFVFFGERDSALQAIEKMHGQEFHGSVIDCSLAKPQSDARKKVVQARALSRQQQSYMNTGMPMMDPSYGGYYGYGAAAGTDPYGTGAYNYGYGAGAGIQYPMMGASRGAARPPMMRGGPRASMRGGAPGMRARASPAMAAQYRMSRGAAALGSAPVSGMRGSRGGNFQAKRPMNGGTPTAASGYPSANPTAYGTTGYGSPAVGYGAATGYGSATGYGGATGYGAAAGYGSTAAAGYGSTGYGTTAAGYGSAMGAYQAATPATAGYMGPSPAKRGRGAW